MACKTDATLAVVLASDGDNVVCIDGLSAAPGINNVIFDNDVFPAKGFSCTPATTFSTDDWVFPGCREYEGAVITQISDYKIQHAEQSGAPVANLSQVTENTYAMFKLDNLPEVGCKDSSIYDCDYWCPRPPPGFEHLCDKPCPVRPFTNANCMPIQLNGQIGACAPGREMVAMVPFKMLRNGFDQYSAVACLLPSELDQLGDQQLLDDGTKKLYGWRTERIHFKSA